MEQDTIRTTVFGTVGTITSLSLAQVNYIVGIFAGVLTCVYVGYGILERHDKRKRGKIKHDLNNDNQSSQPNQP